MKDFWIFVAIVVGLGLVMACPWMPTEAVMTAAVLVIFTAGVLAGKQLR